MKKMKKKTLAVTILLAAIVASALAFLLIDLDSDGLMNWEEWTLSSDINKSDTDGDGLDDGQEKQIGTNPIQADTDGDRLDDGQEEQMGTSPILVDTDGDSLLDGTCILLKDSDERCHHLRQQRILNELFPNGMYLFYGEVFFRTNACVYNPGAAEQWKFLQTLSDDEYQQLESKGLLLNNNLDGDHWTNYFEVTFSNTPYDVKNDVYVILMTLDGREFENVDKMNKFFEETMKLPPENIHSFSGEDNNPENWENAVNDIAQKSDENDVVFINLGGHGDMDIFYFYTEEGVHYQWINETLDKIESKLMFVANEACHSGSSIKYLEGSNRIILTQCSANESLPERVEVGVCCDCLYAFCNSSADIDGNCCVSIGEAAEYAKEAGIWENPTSPWHGRHPEISDIGNLGQTCYFLEYRLGE